MFSPFTHTHTHTHTLTHSELMGVLTNWTEAVIPHAYIYEIFTRDTFYIHIYIYILFANSMSIELQK